MKTITARVVYPVDVEIEISDEDYSILSNLDAEPNFDIIEKITQKLKEKADNQFETSTVKSIIVESTLSVLCE